MNKTSRQKANPPDDFMEQSDDWMPVSRRVPWFVVLGGGLLLALQIGFMALVLVTVRQRDHSSQLQQFRLGVEVTAESQSRAMAAWLDPHRAIAAGLGKDPQLTQFADGLSGIERQLDLRDKLAQTLPDLRRHLDRLVRETGAERALLLGPNGGLLLGEDDFGADQDVMNWAAGLLGAGTDSSHMRLAMVGGQPKLLLAQGHGSQKPASLAILVMAMPIDLIGLRDAAEAGGHTILVQRIGGASHQLRTDRDGRLELVPVTAGDRGLERTGFHLDEDGREIFATTRVITDSPWFLNLSVPVTMEPVVLLLTQVNEFTGALLGLLLADILLLLLIVRAFRIQGEDYDREGGLMARRMRERHELFQAMARTVTGLIAVKDGRGRYTYVNRSMADMLEREPEDLTGLNDFKIFPLDTARALVALDDEARASGQPVSVFEDLNLGQRRRHLRVSSLALRDDGRNVTGSVMIAQDMTETVDLARQRERHLEQVVLALGETVGLADPHLAGHSGRVREISVQVARLLAVEEDEIEVLKLAATLSQLGKLAIPRSILTKEDRLTDEEQDVMKEHVAMTLRIIEGIEFPGPVAKTIAHMHERQDGSGYPKGLRGVEISFLGRILGVADVFVARTSPRAYRNAIEAKEAVSVFEAYPQRYDPMVVSAIRTISGL